MVGTDFCTVMMDIFVLLKSVAILKKKIFSFPISPGEFIGNVLTI